jgi:hypothetical protein
MKKLLEKSRSFIRLAKEKKSIAVVALLWILSIVAISEVWRTDAPAMEMRRVRMPAKAAVHMTSWIPLAKRDGIAVVTKKRKSITRTGIVKRASVQLTKKQASFVSNLGKYLKSVGESATVTSGARSPQHQLAIIKSKIHEVGATRQFPELKRATVQKTSTWMRAWEYLRARHVPVNAPASAGGEAETSNHIKGLAIDLIAGSLDHLRNLVLGFSHSIFAKKSSLQVASIAREPGCVHINLRG